MMNPRQHEEYRVRCLQILAQAGIAVRHDEAARLELAELHLGHFEIEGLGLIVYENNVRDCAKELIMLPGQTCPQHRHPPVGSDPGKQETFRCRWGRIYLYVDGPKHPSPAARPPAGKEAYYTVWHQLELGPGDQYTIPPDTWHWFQSGPQGAVVSEFSSTSRDEFDVFTDPGIIRVAPAPPR